jgi:hypothetical protein
MTILRGRQRCGKAISPDENQVIGPALDFEIWVSPRNESWPEHPGLKSETWATHLVPGRCSLFFARASLALFVANAVINYFGVTYS